MNIQNQDDEKYFQSAAKFDLRQKVAIRKILEDLPLREKQIIQLHYWESLSLTEIAHILRMDWAGVKKIFDAAHGRLRQMCLKHRAFKHMLDRSDA